MSKSEDISDIPGSLENMSKSGDISDLPGNLAKMSVSPHNIKHKYTLNLKNNYTKCSTCSFDIALTKNALSCTACSNHWFCSAKCVDLYQGEYCLHVEFTSCNSLELFHLAILRFYDMETLNMVKEYISSQEGVSREDMKKLAEAGDWKAALIIGLTYEFRFVLDWDECELAIRPPFMKSRPFSHRKAIKYYNMAAEENSIEASAGIVRALGTQIDNGRAMIDHLYKSSKFKLSKELLSSNSFSELRITQDEIKKKCQEGEVLSVNGISGVMLFRLNLVNSTSSVIDIASLPTFIVETLSMMKACKQCLLLCYSYNLLIGVQDFPRSVHNTIFVQKSNDGENKTKLGIDPGVRMDAKAVFDQGYLQRLHHDQPMYLCEHNVQSIGNTCTQCALLARERVLSVYENSFQLSRDELLVSRFYGVIFTLESGLKKQDYFWIHGKYEIITAIRVMALQPMDLHPLQLAKDPSIYWPIVPYYGSVYSALK